MIVLGLGEKGTRGFMVLLSAPAIGQWGTVSACSALIGWWAEQCPLVTSSSGEAVDHLLRAAGVLGGASLPWALPSRHLALSPMSEAEDHEVTTWGSRCPGIHAAIAMAVPTAA